MTEGLFALGGVLLGAVLGWWGERSQRLAARADARRLELIDLVSGFLRDADTAWLAIQELMAAIAEIQSDRKTPVGWEMREKALTKAAQPRQDALLAIGKMRLLAPHLVEPAAAIIAAQESYGLDSHQEDVAAREAAMLRLEEATRPLVI